MTATMDSSGGSFTLTPSSSHDFVAAPQLCKVKFNVAYNPTYTAVTFIDRYGNPDGTTGTFISYASRDFAVF